MAHRIDHFTRRVDANGPGKDGFSEGDATIQTPATRITDDWLNDVQETLVQAIEANGITPVKGDFTQLQQAIQAAIDATSPRTFVFNSTQLFFIPSWATGVLITCVGAGGAGGDGASTQGGGSDVNGGGGGGSGSLAECNFPVSALGGPGASLTANVGMGDNNSGDSSYVERGGTKIIEALGGQSGGFSHTGSNGGLGWSGGGNGGEGGTGAPENGYDGGDRGFNGSGPGGGDGVGSDLRAAIGLPGGSGGTATTYPGGGGGGGGHIDLTVSAGSGEDSSGSGAAGGEGGTGYGAGGGGGAGGPQENNLRGQGADGVVVVTFFI